ncbi:hypothetical protein F4810DRAFT_687251 [Camillea tinctor]|nr:hypothetical protein F4810DRAFT_687251 [Camillea tinctor]
MSASPRRPPILRFNPIPIYHEPTVEDGGDDSEYSSEFEVVRRSEPHSGLGIRSRSVSPPWGTPSQNPGGRNQNRHQSGLPPSNRPVSQRITITSTSRDSPSRTNENRKPDVSRQSNDSPYYTGAGKRSSTTESIENLYPKNKVKHTPAPSFYRIVENSNRGGESYERQGYYPRQGPPYNVGARAPPYLPRLRREDKMFRGSIGLPQFNGPRGRIGNISLGLSDINTPIDEDIEKLVEQGVEKRLDAIKEEEERQADLEEAIRRKIEKERQEIEEAKQREAEEKARMERQIREMIEAESRAAAKAKEDETGWNDKSARLIQVKVQQEIDEIMVLLRGKIQQELGIGSRADTEEKARKAWSQPGSQARRKSSGRRRTSKIKASTVFTPELSTSPQIKPSRYPPESLNPSIQSSYRLPSPQDGDSSPPLPPRAPEPPGSDADTESDAQTVLTSVSRRPRQRRGTDRLLRLKLEERSRERKERKTLRAIRDELALPIARTLAVGLADAAYGHAQPMPFRDAYVYTPPSTRDFYEERFPQGSREDINDFEPQYEPQYEPANSAYESVRSSSVPSGLSNIQSRGPEPLKWRAPTHTTATSHTERSVSRGRTMERLRDQVEESSQKKLPVGPPENEYKNENENIAALDDDYVMIEAFQPPGNPVFTANRESKEEGALKDLRGDGVDNTTESETVVEIGRGLDDKRSVIFFFSLLLFLWILLSVLNSINSNLKRMKDTIMR